jgi:hypothetical protein
MTARAESEMGSQKASTKVKREEKDLRRRLGHLDWLRFHILMSPSSGLFRTDTYNGYWVWLRQYKLPPGVSLPGFVEGRGVFKRPEGTPPPALTPEDIAHYAKIDALIATQKAQREAAQAAHAAGAGGGGGGGGGGFFGGAFGGWGWGGSGAPGQMDLEAYGEEYAGEGEDDDEMGEFR